MEEQLAAQINPDGSHFEQSTYYHVYAVDFFVFYYLLAGKPAHLEPAIVKTAEYLHWLLGPARRIAYFGDDDGGRLFHPQGRRDEFGRATLATCGILFNREEWVGTREDIAVQAAWWLGAKALSEGGSSAAPPQGSQNTFPTREQSFCNPKISTCSSTPVRSVGPVPATVTPILLASLSGETTNCFSAIPEPILTLVTPLIANAFVAPLLTTPSTSIASLKPNPPAPFAGLTNRLSNCAPLSQAKMAASSTLSANIVALPIAGGSVSTIRELMVLDEISGPPGEHQINQFWNLGPAADQVHLSFSHPCTEIPAEFSPAYGVKVPARALLVQSRASLPAALAMSLDAREKHDITVDYARQMFDNKVSNFHTS